MKEQNCKDDAFYALPTPVPEPEESSDQSQTSNNTPTFTSDDIHAEIVGIGDDGYSRSAIAATLEVLHGIDENTDPEQINDENYEFVRTMDIMYAAVDIYSIDGDIVNVIFTFDSVNDVFVKELRDITKSYRMLYEKILDDINAAEDRGQKSEKTSVPQLSITFMPYKYQGVASATYSNPIAWFVTVAEEESKGQFHMIFHMSDVSYDALDISEDVKADIVAEVQRKIEARQNTQFH